MTLLLEAMHGEEIFDTQNAKVALFVVPSKEFTEIKHEIALPIAAGRSECSVTRHTLHGKFNSWMNGNRDDLGKWTHAVYRVPEGVILKIFARKHTGFGRATKAANVFIMMRNNAAYRKLAVVLTGNEKARYTNAIIKGRFDVLTLEQALRRGVSVPSQYRRLFDPENMEGLIEQEDLEAEIEPMTIYRERTIRGRNNETKVIAVSRKQRSLELDEE